MLAAQVLQENWEINCCTWGLSGPLSLYTRLPLAIQGPQGANPGLRKPHNNELQLAAVVTATSSHRNTVSWEWLTAGRSAESWFSQLYFSLIVETTRTRAAYTKHVKHQHCCNEELSYATKDNTIPVEPWRRGLYSFSCIQDPYSCSLLPAQSSQLSHHLSSAFLLGYTAISGGGGRRKCSQLTCIPLAVLQTEAFTGHLWVSTAYPREESVTNPHPWLLRSTSKWSIQSN